MKAIEVTYREIFACIHRSEDFAKLGINQWYIAEGGSPGNVKFLSHGAAKVLGISDEEFNRRYREFNDESFVTKLKEEKKLQKIELEGILTVDLWDGRVTLDGEDIYYALNNYQFTASKVKITIEEIQ